MTHLVDTSVLVRPANAAGPFHAVAVRGALELHRRGEALHVTAQNLVEFRNAATRPKAVNGLGLSCLRGELPAFGPLLSIPEGLQPLAGG